MFAENKSVAHGDLLGTEPGNLDEYKIMFN